MIIFDVTEQVEGKIPERCFGCQFCIDIPIAGEWAYDDGRPEDKELICGLLGYSGRIGYDCRGNSEEYQEELMTKKLDNCPLVEV